MKKLGLLIAALAFFAVTPAKAALFPTENLGMLSVGDTGSFTNSGFGTYGMAEGFIPSNSSITFTYTFSSEPAWGNLNAAGLASYKVGKRRHTYFSDSAGINTFSVGLRTRVLPFDEMLVQASADQNGFTTTITNLTEAAAGFGTAFVGYLGKGVSLTNVSYAVSAVPVPAALPLFGLALVGAAGYSRRKKKAA